MYDEAMTSAEFVEHMYDLSVQELSRYSVQREEKERYLICPFPTKRCFINRFLDNLYDDPGCEITDAEEISDKDYQSLIEKYKKVLEQEWQRISDQRLIFIKEHPEEFSLSGNPKDAVEQWAYDDGECIK